jgi:hypothetical protein
MGQVPLHGNCAILNRERYRSILSRRYLLVTVSGPRRRPGLGEPRLRGTKIPMTLRLGLFRGWSRSGSRGFRRWRWSGSRGFRRWRWGGSRSFRRWGRGGSRSFRRWRRGGSRSFRGGRRGRSRSFRSWGGGRSFRCGSSRLGLFFRGSGLFLRGFRLRFFLRRFSSRLFLDRFSGWFRHFFFRCRRCLFRSGGRGFRGSGFRSRLFSGGRNRRIRATRSRTARWLRRGCTAGENDERSDQNGPTQHRLNLHETLILSRNLETYTLDVDDRIVEPWTPIAKPSEQLIAD